MNDAFDLVSATIEGIIGQVIGNLAPAVTDIANQFLEFLETFQGADGTGGTGIANAITKVLFDGAEFFAGIFDSFVKNFEGISTTLADVGEVFRIGGQLLLSGMEGFRAVFNVIQIGIDQLLIGFGKVLEGIGSWVSDDLEQFGAGLAAAAEESAKKNAAEFDAAAANAAKAFNGALFGGDATAAGEGAATKAIQGARDRFEREKAPEFKITANLEKTQKDLDSFLADANGGASEFLQQSTATLDTFKKMAGEGSLTADQIKIMNGFMQNVNAELDKELQAREKAKDAATAQAEADGKRVDALLKTGDAASKLEEDLAAVERQRAAVAEQGGEDAQARLAELDALKAKLEEQQQALEQGFGQGFEQAFQGADKAVDTAIEKAAEFGQVGFDAAKQLSDGIAAAKAKVKDGILGAPAFDNEVARQQQLFDQRIQLEKDAAAERKKAEDEAAKVRLQQEELVNNLIKMQQVGGDQERIAAAENLVAINAEIARAEQAAAEARKAGDGQAQQAALTRLQQLDQVKAKEEDIASGAAKQRELFQQQFIKQQEEAAKVQQQQQQAAAQEQARFAEARRKAEEAEYNRQVARIAELNTLGSRTVNTADIRTQEGQALVLGLAANAQDPALIEARLQTKQLQLIAQGIGQAAANYFNTPVAIVGGARLAGFN
jgi:hypothetical protein